MHHRIFAVLLLSIPLAFHAMDNEKSKASDTRSQLISRRLGFTVSAGICSPRNLDYRAIPALCEFHCANILSAAASKDGSICALGCEDGFVHIFDMKQYKKLFSLKCTCEKQCGCCGGVRSLTLNADGSICLARGTESLSIIDIKTQKIQHQFNKRLFGSSFFCDDTHCVVASHYTRQGENTVWKNEILILDTHMGKIIGSIDCVYPINSLVVSTKSLHCIAGLEDGSVCFIDLKQGKIENTILTTGRNKSPCSITRLALNADESQCAVIARDCTVNIIDMNTKELICSSDDVGVRTAVIAWNSNGFQCVTVSEGQACIVDTQTGDIQQIIGLHYDDKSICCSPFWVTPSSDGTVQVRDMNSVLSGNPMNYSYSNISNVLPLEYEASYKQEIKKIAASSDGSICALAYKNSIHFIDLKNGQKWECSVGKSNHYVSSVALSGDGSICLAGVNYEDSVVIVDVRNQKIRHKIPCKDYQFNAVVLSAHGNVWAIGSHQGILRVGDTTTGRIRYSISCGDGVESIALNADGSQCIVGCSGSACFIDIEKNEINHVNFEDSSGWNMMKQQIQDIPFKRGYGFLGGTSVAINTDGSHCALISSSGSMKPNYSLKIIDMKTKKIKHTIENVSCWSQIAWDTKDVSRCIATQKGRVNVIDTRLGEIVRTVSLNSENEHQYVAPLLVTQSGERLSICNMNSITRAGLSDQ